MEKDFDYLVMNNIELNTRIEDLKLEEKELKKELKRFNKLVENAESNRFLNLEELNVEIARVEKRLSETRELLKVYNSLKSKIEKGIDNLMSAN